MKLTKTKAIILGLGLTIIIPTISIITLNHKKINEKSMVASELNSQYQVILNNEIDKTKKEYQAKIDDLENQINKMNDENKEIKVVNKSKDNSNKSSISFDTFDLLNKERALFMKYFLEQDKTTFSISVDGTGNTQILKYEPTKEDKGIKDNKNEISNYYTINHKVTKNNDKFFNDITLTVKSDKEEEFDINNHLFLLEYLKNICGKSLTNTDCNAINVQVNMDLSKLSSIKELNAYIYNKDGLKINDLLFKAQKNKDNPKIVEFKISTIK